MGAGQIGVHLVIAAKPVATDTVSATGLVPLRNQLTEEQNARGLLLNLKGAN